MRDSRQGKDNLVSVFVTMVVYGVAGSSILPLVQVRAQAEWGDLRRRGNICQGTLALKIPNWSD